MDGRCPCRHPKYGTQCHFTRPHEGNHVARNPSPPKGILLAYEAWPANNTPIYSPPAPAHSIWSPPVRTSNRDYPAKKGRSPR
jgi:hypothetical protein